MRKVLLMASMLAMVMLAASPVLAQSGGQNVNSQLCQNIIGDVNVEGGDNVAASQYQYGDVAQENNTNVAIVQSCLQQAEQNAGGGEAPAGEAPAGEAPAGDEGAAPADEEAAPSGAPSGSAQSGGQNVSQQVCQNIIGDVNVQGGDNVAASQYQYGDIAQENNTNVAIVQECLQQVNQTAGGGDTGGGTPPEDPAPAPDDPAPGDDQYEAPAPGGNGGGGDAPAPDAGNGMTDGGMQGTPEAGAPEAGAPEAGAPEAGAPEAGTPEAGTPAADTPEQGVQAPEAAPAGAPAEAPASSGAAAPDAAPSSAEFVPSAPAEADGQPASTPVEVLPDTGGASLLTLGAGILLVAGGLIARRVVRA